MKKFDRKILRQIAAAFDWGVGRKFDLPTSVIHADAPHWRNYVMSPMLSVSPKLTAKDLAAVEKHFLKNPGKFEFDNKAPYIQWLENSYFDRRANIHTLVKNGWTNENSPKDSYLNIWIEAEPVEIPTGYEVVAGSYANPQLRKDFLKLSRTIFKASPLFMNELDDFNLKIKAGLMTVLIYRIGKGGMRSPVAAGLAHTKGRSTYLLCGCVTEKHREKGLWRLLLSTRQALSNSGPGHLWMLTTRNEHLRNIGQHSARWIIFSKRIDVS